jgi:hypothetical protein
LTKEKPRWAAIFHQCQQHQLNTLLLQEVAGVVVLLAAEAAQVVSELVRLP